MDMFFPAFYTGIRGIRLNEMAQNTFLVYALWKRISIRFHNNNDAINSSLEIIILLYF